MSDDAPDGWAALADRFADDAYATVKGYVRTYVLHHHLTEHLTEAPGSVLDVGGGAGHQSYLLAQLGHRLTLLDSSAAMLDKARQRLAQLPVEVQQRVRLIQADGTDATAAVEGEQFDTVLCHGVLGYLDRPEPMLDQLVACAAPGGLISIMTGNARTMAVRPALEQRWSDALTAFDSPSEIGVLGVPARADTVDELSERLTARGANPLQWYGVWLFVDWLEFGGATPDAAQREQIAAVELEASRRDPYRQLGRVFHLLAQKNA